MTYTFYDTCTGATITMMTETEDEAWMDLADNFGACYVMDNIQYIGRNRLDS